MKTKARKQEDLNALTEQFKNSKSAMVLSFTGLTVDKDQAFRNELRETGARYKVVKNTLARLAVKGTSFEDATDHFKGVTSVAWTDNEPVDLSKVISKYLKEEKDVSHYDTVASLYSKLGQKRKAKRYAKKGIKYAKSQNEDFDGLTDLIDILEGRKELK